MALRDPLQTQQAWALTLLSGSPPDLRVSSANNTVGKTQWSSLDSLREGIHMLSIQLLGAFRARHGGHQGLTGTDPEPTSKALPSGWERWTGQSAMRPVKQEGVLDDRGGTEDATREGVTQATWAGSPSASGKQQAL